MRGMVDPIAPAKPKDTGERPGEILAFSFIAGFFTAGWHRPSPSLGSNEADRAPHDPGHAVGMATSPLIANNSPLSQQGRCAYIAPMARSIDLEALCHEKGLRITDQRRVIARVLSEAEDHPDVEKVYARASAIDPGISIATVYRTVRLFEEAGILDRHDFGDGRARYEPSPEAHHDHLIDVETGRVIEFVDPELEQLQKQIAEKLGFRLVDHRMELYGVSLSRKD
jgi:Fur family ferric uptake transcriptional regulator